MNQLYACAALLCCHLLAAQVPVGAVGHWPFDNHAQDLSGNGNHGTASNTVPYPDRFGNANKAYKFNGINSKVVVPHSITVDIGPNQDFTFAIWEKAYNDNVNRTIVAKHMMGSWDGYWLGAAPSNPGYCNAPQHIDFYTASAYQQDACSDTTIMQDSSWHFLTGVYKAATQTNYLYIDGVLQADTGQCSGTLSNSANLSFGFFSQANANFFHGVLDDGRLYKRALTQAEILQLYNEGKVNGLNEWAGTTPVPILFPNPGTGLFTLSVANGSGNMMVEVYSVLGQLVLQQQLQVPGSNLDLQKHTAGVYTVKLLTPQGQQSLKLVKE